MVEHLFADLRVLVEKGFESGVRCWFRAFPHSSDTNVSLKQKKSSISKASYSVDDGQQLTRGN